MNFVLFYVVFPWAANLSGKSSITLASNLSNLKIQVDVPCSGHAPLVIYELKKAGVSEVSFSNPDVFDIKYDSGKISKDEIVKLKLFEDFKIKRFL